MGSFIGHALLPETSKAFSLSVFLPGAHDHILRRVHNGEFVVFLDSSLVCGEAGEDLEVCDQREDTHHGGPGQHLGSSGKHPLPPPPPPLPIFHPFLLFFLLSSYLLFLHFSLLICSSFCPLFSSSSSSSFSSAFHFSSPFPFFLFLISSLPFPHPFTPHSPKPPLFHFSASFIFI